MIGGWSNRRSDARPGHGSVALRERRRGSPRARRSTMRIDASISSASAGCRSRQRPMRGRSQRCANDGSTVTRSRCASPAAAAAAACTPSSSCASAPCTLRSSAWPAGLSTTRRPRRSNSAKPRRSSSTRICWLTALCVRCSASAAARRLPARPPSRNAASVFERQSRHVVSTAYQFGRNIVAFPGTLAVNLTSVPTRPGTAMCSYPHVDEFGNPRA